jgi:XTP/dITP diphosphohydrolase
VRRFLLATANQEKAAEIREVLHDANQGLELVAAPRGLLSVEETGETIEDNARLKAVALCEATGQPVVADDTGLEVDVLDGAPGVRAARYAGEGAGYDANLRKLLSELEGVPREQRTARFTTVAIARWPDGREVAAIGTVEGLIAAEARGTGGWGYDPVFVPANGDGRTFAEMTSDEKHALSHRGRAFRALADRLRVVTGTERN